MLDLSLLPVNTNGIGSTLQACPREFPLRPPADGSVEPGCLLLQMGYETPNAASSTTASPEPGQPQRLSTSTGSPLNGSRQPQQEHRIPVPLDAVPTVIEVDAATQPATTLSPNSGPVLRPAPLTDANQATLGDTGPSRSSHLEHGEELAEEEAAEEEAAEEDLLTTSPEDDEADDIVSSPFLQPQLPLPEGWTLRRDRNGRPVYYNDVHRYATPTPPRRPGAVLPATVSTARLAEFDDRQRREDAETAASLASFSLEDSRRLATTHQHSRRSPDSQPVLEEQEEAEAGVQPQQGQVQQPPQPSISTPDTEADQRNGDDNEDERDDEEPLPLGWVKNKTRSGKVYFIDHNTRTTTWRDPRRAQARFGTSTWGMFIGRQINSMEIHV